MANSIMPYVSRDVSSKILPDMPHWAVPRTFDRQRPPLSMPRFYFHIRTRESFDPDYDGVEIRADDGIAEAIAIARRMVFELVTNNEPIDGLWFEITNCHGLLVAELPFRSCAQLQ
ncbi:hypothetical protein [Rhizobium sp. WYJ-E13]|uniref:DUF6894 family protein n=1 Tax=Rhizobium sp. WYJ-E13 TaxID=2849093 RepID=UPI0020A73D35|nr:hypothetical protein [Rhizobium sp. WYJ-E13]